jgi:sensor histidine kinase YesM
MAVLPFRPTPFFRDKNAAFWRLNFIGWGGALVFRAVSAIANEQPWSHLALVVIQMVTGFSISLLMSVVYRQLFYRKLIVTAGFTALVLALAVSLFAFIDSWVIGLYRPDSESGFAQRFIGVFFFDLMLLGAWTALYFAINFFLQVEEQSDRLERLEAQATGAQLAMLRYQLNPHFLFNTLNSISTLVLLKQTDPANAMLTRLSRFLRHTLESNPGGKVTLAQEVDTLRLYLDIERMRFEERLRTEFRIEHRAARAMLPSLLLQPLVENAIKYAVSPQEEGAKITLTAQVIGETLRITVSDSGPGPDAEPAEDTVSTGVGLPNIRDRLAQAYGEEHRFETRTPPDGGFTVLIEIPFEEMEEEEAAVEMRKPALRSTVSSLQPEGRLVG